jgi:hypothetical protein
VVRYSAIVRHLMPNDIIICTHSHGTSEMFNVNLAEILFDFMRLMNVNFDSRPAPCSPNGQLVFGFEMSQSKMYKILIRPLVICRDSRTRVSYRFMSQVNSQA